jgi:hypothetical protein
MPGWLWWSRSRGSIGGADGGLVPGRVPLGRFDLVDVVQVVRQGLGVLPGDLSDRLAPTPG